VEDDEVTGRAKGGVARAAILSKKERREIARKGAEARWGKDKPYATHEGVIRIGDIEIACAVLNTGQRVITQSGFMRALGRARQAKGRSHYKGDVNLPAFLTAQNLKPFVSSVLEVTSSQIEFRPLGGGRAFGYADELLPEVCDVFVKAARAGALLQNQQHIADQAHIIIKGLARLGIAGLIDEATGYQEVRDKHALQALLDAYLRKELAAWPNAFQTNSMSTYFDFAVGNGKVEVKIRLKPSPVTPKTSCMPALRLKSWRSLSVRILLKGAVEKRSITNG